MRALKTMSEAGNIPPPDDAPLALGKDEIERLLTEAESLVSEIAGTVGASEDESLTKEGRFSPAPEAPDALTAVEMATVQVEEIEQAVGVEPSPTGARGADATNDELLIQAESDAALPTSETATIEDDASPAMTLDGRRGEVELRGQVEAELRGPIDKAVLRGPTGEAETPVAEVTEVPAEAGPKPLSVRIGRSLAMTLRNVVVAVPNNFVRLFILLDRPFAGFSPSTKLALGLIGLISLLMGIAAFVLPKFGGHNPYEGLKPYAG